VGGCLMEPTGQRRTAPARIFEGGAPFLILTRTRDGCYLPPNYSADKCMRPKGPNPRRSLPAWS
jgi:hypothetical protein